MTDMTQLESAFMKAHEAGDTQAASVLAAEIKRRRAETETTQPVSGLTDQLKAGFDAPLENMGVSMEAAGKGLGIDTLQSTGKSLRDATQQPQNFVSASDRFINPKQGDSLVDPLIGFGWGNLPGAVAEQTGQITGSVAARSAGAAAGGAIGSLSANPAGAATGAAVGALAGPALFEFLQQVGPIAIQRAQNNGRADPNWEDWSAAAVTAGASGALNSIGVQGVGVLNNGLKQIGKNIVKEGLTEAGQSVVEQTGETAGTDKGLTVDPRQAIGEGVLGAGSAGVVDATVHGADAMSRTSRDNRAVNREINDNPFAATDAEIVQDINRLADRSTQVKGKELQTKEVNSLRNDYENQAKEAIKSLGLKSTEYNALMQAIKKPDGLTDERLNEISNLPGGEEVRALAQKLQRLRQLTVQTQSQKGWRGFTAAALSSSGQALGAGIGYHVTQSPGGVFIGGAIGDKVSRSLASKLRNSKTQGANINEMVDPKRLRRAQQLLQRVGPSQATQALNTLTQMGEERKAQVEAEKQAKLDWEDTLRRMKEWTTQRAKLDKEMKAAFKKVDQDALKKKKETLDLAYRETRLKNAQFRAVTAQAKAEADVAKLEQQKSMNAITVELAKAKMELEAAKAKATTDSLQKKADAETKMLESRVAMLSIDLQKRQAALDKVKRSAQRTEKLGYKGPKLKPEVYAMAKARVEMEKSGIFNPRNYDQKVQELNALKDKAREVAKTLSDEGSQVLLNTLNRIEAAKNDTAKRKAAYEDGLMDIKSHGDTMEARKFHDALYELAHMDFKTKPKSVELPPFPPEPQAPQPSPETTEPETPKRQEWDVHAPEDILSYQNTQTKNWDDRVSELEALERSETDPVKHSKIAKERGELEVKSLAEKLNQNLPPGYKAYPNHYVIDHANPETQEQYGSLYVWNVKVKNAAGDEVDTLYAGGRADSTLYHLIETFKLFGYLPNKEQRRANEDKANQTLQMMGLYDFRKDQASMMDEEFRPMSTRPKADVLPFPNKNEQEPPF